MIYLPERPLIPLEDDVSGLPDESDVRWESVWTEETTEDAAAEDASASMPHLVADTTAFFAPDGTLQQSARLEGRECEFRPQQLAMARAVAGALTSGRNLAVEAPTGVGKSFAYLAPLVFRARGAGRPALVSTETINLQEQLVHKDIPLLRELTGIDFKAALAKGRGNYLCLRRLLLSSGEQRDAMLPQPSLALDLERIADWADQTEDGERDSLPGRVAPEAWALVCCEGGSCQGPKCGFFRSCFYFKARQEWEAADIVVANHALFFTDLGMRGEGPESGLLPNYGAVVIDEAHTLEDNAAEYLGMHLSRAGIMGMLNRLFQPESARGLLMRAGSDTLALRQIIAALREEVSRFFAPFEAYLRENPDRREGGGEGGARRIRECGRFADTLSEPLKVLYRKLAELLDEQEDEAYRTELQAQLDRCRGYIDGIRAFIGMELPDSVYFVESDRGGVVLNAAPLNVADLLRELLFTRDFPVILSSATLTVRGGFDFFCGRTGFDSGDTLLLDSPFKREQAQVLIDRAMPEPTHAEYQEALVREIPRYLEMTGGKAFVLFTSYATLRYCAEQLRPYFAEKGWTLLVQGGELSRSAMLRTFREDVDSVLFGTDSFWTGVDVPGEALSNVIVTKLPFPSPGHPVVAARGERIEAGGGSSFRDYSLPSAVLKFRQGAGRLIRGRQDRGIIVILDRRVISKGYGRSFLDSLPYPLVFDGENNNRAETFRRNPRR